MDTMFQKQPTSSSMNKKSSSFSKVTTSKPATTTSSLKSKISLQDDFVSASNWDEDKELDDLIGDD